MGVGKTPVVLGVLVGIVKGLCLSWGLSGRSETLQQLPTARVPTPTATPRQRKKQGLWGPKLPLPSPSVSWAGQREAGLDWLPPSPRARPSCVVSLVGLPWRWEARPAPTHGNYSQGVSHCGAQAPPSRPGRMPPPPPSRPLTSMPSCLTPE